MSSKAAANSKPIQVVAVVGPTGVGKSKLGIELCQRFNGEIVNTDAMQMYKGLDIATAKVTQEEQQLVKHHLLGVLDPADSCTVHAYRDRAIRVVEDIASRGKLPVLVGGTLYYVQSLLWPSLIDEGNGSKATEVSQFQGKESTVQGSSKGDQTCASSPTPIERQAKIDQIDSNKLYEKLKKVDPEMAAQWHPNDTRKIERSLQVYEETGIPHSEIIRRQEEQGVPEKLRWDCRVMWLTCDSIEHNERLRGRVDDMVQQGLVEEARDFLKTHTSVFEDSLKADENQQSNQFSSGNLQAIGYREFLPYFKAETQAPNPDKTIESNTKPINLILDDCIENLKIKHRQYARKQMRWVISRMLNRTAPVVKLDTTGYAANKNVWKDNILEPACEVVQDMLESADAGRTLTEMPPFPTRPALRTAGIESFSNSPNTKEDRLARQQALRQQFVCKDCNGKVIQGKNNWEIHLKSSSHRKVLKRKRKSALVQEARKMAQGKQ